MKLLYGKPIAQEILDRLKSAIFQCDQKPGLAVVLVGDDSASHIYVNLKEKAAREIGMAFFRFQFEKTVEEKMILETLAEINADERIHGVIVQLPLPAHFDTQKIIDAIQVRKDADGFHPENTARFLAGNGLLWPVFPHAIVKLIKGSGEDLAGKKGVVLANSAEFGSVMCAALEREKIDAEYVLREELPAKLSKVKEADVVVSAVGSPGLLRGEMFKEGAIVIDGGIEKVGEKVVGDVDFASTEGKNGFLTPVPGGVGPVTIACLLENVYESFKAQQKEK